MSTRTIRKWLASSACVALLGSLATLASGFPTCGNGPYSLPSNGTLDIYTAPATPAQLVGVTVADQTGAVRARCYAGGTYYDLGVVPAGMACVFEGPFAKANLIANVGAPPPAASGTFVVRGPTDGPDPDRLIGSGTLTFGSGAGTYSPYGAFSGMGQPATMTRTLTVDLVANSEPATITGGTGPAYVVDGGDWGFCSRAITKFTVSGKNAVPFAVYDPKAGCNTISGVARGQTAGDVDSLSVDGVKALDITLTNNGAGAVSLTYKLAGGQQTTVSIPAGGSSPPVVGPVEKFEWTYANAGCGVSISVRGH